MIDSIQKANLGIFFHARYNPCMDTKLLSHPLSPSAHNFLHPPSQSHIPVGTSLVSMVKTTYLPEVSMSGCVRHGRKKYPNHAGYGSLGFIFERMFGWFLHPGLASQRKLWRAGKWFTGGDITAAVFGEERPGYHFRELWTLSLYGVAIAGFPFCKLLARF
jgi:hypothetical protein